MFAGFRCGGDGLLACVRELTDRHLPAAPGGPHRPGCCRRSRHGAKVDTRVRADMAPTAARSALCPRVARRPGDRPPGSRLRCVCRPRLSFSRTRHLDWDQVGFTCSRMPLFMVLRWRCGVLGRPSGRYSGSDEAAFTCSRARPLGGRPRGCGRAHRRGPGAARHEVVTTEPSKSG
jgi:hypothetical protein